MRTWILTITLCILLLLLVPGGHLHAHARLDRSAPAAGATLDQPPVEVRIWATQELRLSGNALSVADSDGNQVDNGDGRVDQSDRNRKQLVVSLPQLSSGTYTVTFTTSSAEDGHDFTGSFIFTLQLAEGGSSSPEDLALVEGGCGQ